MEIGNILSIISALTALIAVIISPYLAMKQLRASFIPSKRQEWLNSLRDSMAEFISLSFKTRYLINKKPLIDPEFDQHRKELLQVQYKIKFFMDIKKENHKELIKISEQICNYSHNYSDEEFKNLTESFVELGRKIIEEAWGKIKKLK